MHENSIHAIIKLYGRDGRDDAEEEDSVNGMTVAEVAHQFLLRVCTRPGVGVCFPDQGWYKQKRTGKDVAEGEARALARDSMGDDGQAEGTYGTGLLYNQLLGNIVRKIGKQAAEEPKIAELTQAILQACPELVSSFWPYSGLAVEPKLSARWLATMAFIGHVMSAPLPRDETFKVSIGPVKQDKTRDMVLKDTPPSVQVIVEAILPSPLMKAYLAKGLASAAPGLVQHTVALSLARALQKFLKVKALFGKFAKEYRGEGTSDEVDDPWSKRIRELELEMRKRAPDVEVILAFAQHSAASQALQASAEEADEGAKARAELLTESALRLFDLYYKALPSVVAEVKFDVGKLLVTSSSAKQEQLARKQAREGSVADDVGSLASVGTAGTIGMGGGFGQGRGDVKDFDALSQIHMLEMLSSVKEWDWMKKAGTSAKFTMGELD